jgi:hypothetical protein
VEYCETIDEECGKIAKSRCGIVQVEFWHLSDSYIIDEECFVGNHMDAGDGWYSSDCALYIADIHNQCVD